MRKRPEEQEYHELFVAKRVRYDGPQLVLLSNHMAAIIAVAQNKCAYDRSSVEQAAMVLLADLAETLCERATGKRPVLLPRYVRIDTEHAPVRLP